MVMPSDGWPDSVRESPATSWSRRLRRRKDCLRDPLSAGSRQKSSQHSWRMCSCCARLGNRRSAGESLSPIPGKKWNWYNVEKEFCLWFVLIEFISEHYHLNSVQSCLWGKKAKEREMLSFEALYLANDIGLMEKKCVWLILVDKWLKRISHMTIPKSTTNFIFIF